MHLEEGLEFSFRMTLWRNRGYTLFCNVKWRIIFSQDAKTGICRGTGSNVPTNTSGGASTPADIRHCNHLNLLILRVLKRYFRKKDNFNNFLEQCAYLFREFRVEIMRRHTISVIVRIW
jgi:hypothetical protein